MCADGRSYTFLVQRGVAARWWGKKGGSHRDSKITGHTSRDDGEFGHTIDICTYNFDF